MRAVVQRVRHASVVVDGEEVGACGAGLLILLGVTQGDDEAKAAWLAKKLAGLRIFQDEAGKMNLGLTDIGGEALVVSQFTLYGDCRKGRRPSFVGAAHPSLAEPLYERFCALLEAEGVPVGRGVFGGDMKVSLLNDGPVTLIVDTP
ncbi:MAG: D-tyrosyl-tRNA(Tyr) deacylase [Alphaproteobacteria bacterium]|nr:D-tyrosyl-tRNA(Tyr) deacylase [Alphaproteobacteria bacterium]MCB9791977.1 D-tyrosyl-tRNA(Tyr) deacylase [Alphaproteobacteria bacterium]